MNRFRALPVATLLVAASLGSAAPASAAPTVVRITTDSSVQYDPVWSPDGSTIAYLSLQDGNVGGEIYLSNAAGTVQRRLTFNGDGAAGQKDPDLAWSPDGTRIAFSEQDPGGDGYCCTQPDIYVVNVATGVLTDLTNTTSADGGFGNKVAIAETSPLWSPDGSQIAFVKAFTAFHLYVMSPTGTNVRQLTDGGFESDASWAADGSKLAYVGPNDSIWWVTVDGHHQHQVTPGPGDASPKWSPDGSRIAFRRNTGVYQFPDVFVMNAGGGHVVNVSRTSDLGTNDLIEDAISWSSDGSLLTYSAEDGPGEVDTVSVATPSGSSVQDMLPGAHNFGPVWKPRNHTLALVSDRDEPGNDDIYTVTVP